MPQHIDDAAVRADKIEALANAKDAELFSNFGAGDLLVPFQDAPQNDPMLDVMAELMREKDVDHCHLGYLFHRYTESYYQNLHESQAEEEVSRG